jgi:hypothetical protein
MAITSRRTIQVVLTGDVSYSQNFAAASNATSPGASEVYTLASGNNAISVPEPSGFLVTGVTIIPPSGNTAVLTIKGVNGDTGFALHPTDPSSFGIAAATTSFVINASAGVAGLRIIFT